MFTFKIFFVKINVTLAVHNAIHTHTHEGIRHCYVTWFKSKVVAT